MQIKYVQIKIKKKIYEANQSTKKMLSMAEYYLLTKISIILWITAVPWFLAQLQLENGIFLEFCAKILIWNDALWKN